MRNAGEGQLEIMVNNGNLPNTVQSEETGVYMISFVPEAAGRQTVDITFNKEPHPGMYIGANSECPCILQFFYKAMFGVHTNILCYK